MKSFIHLLASSRLFLVYSSGSRQGEVIDIFPDINISGQIAEF
jgi:hypothetical protein